MFFTSCFIQCFLKKKEDHVVIKDFSPPRLLIVSAKKGKKVK